MQLIHLFFTYLEIILHNQTVIVLFLGNETLVDVYLHEEITSPLKITSTTTSNELRQNFELKTLSIKRDTLDEELDLKDESTDDYDYLEKINLSLSESDHLDFSFTPLELSTDIANQEHDYCQEEIIEGFVENILDLKHEVKEEANNPGCSRIPELDCSQFDHSYCVPFGDESTSTTLTRIKKEVVDEVVVVQGVDNKLRYGLDESYFMDVEEKVDKQVSTVLNRKLGLNYHL